MQKLHVRLSVEVKVPDKLFRKIVDEAMYNGCLCDIEVSWLKDHVDFDTAKPVLEGWDEGGYVPGSWLEYDAIESGMYEKDENGLKRKDGAK